MEESSEKELQELWDTFEYYTKLEMQYPILSLYFLISSTLKNKNFCKLICNKYNISMRELNRIIDIKNKR